MRSFILFCLLRISVSLRGQAALLVLLFGDQLATEKFHLSIEVGGNVPLITGIDGKPQAGWHFGLGTHHNFARQ